MNPAHIYFKEIDIDQDEIFTINFTKENEIANVIFDKDNEHAITGLKINAELPDKKTLKIENVEEQNRVSGEIQEIINNNKDGLGLNYQIKIDPTDAKKIQKKLTLNKLSRKKICIDESRVWNMKTKWRKYDSGKDSSRLSYLISYLYDEQKLKTLLKITGTKHDFTSMTLEEKNVFLNRLTKATHKQSDLYYGNSDTFYFGATNGSSVVLLYFLSYAVLRYTERIQRLFVPKFYHNIRDKNFLKNLIYIGEKKEIDEKYFHEEGTSLGRRLYEYQIDKNNKRPLNIHLRDLDWPFPDKFYESIGYTIHGFSFKFKNVPNSLSSILNPSDNLINIESNTEQAENNLIEELFSKKKRY